MVILAIGEKDRPWTIYDADLVEHVFPLATPVDQEQQRSHPNLVTAIEEEELSMASNDMKTSEMRALPA